MQLISLIQQFISLIHVVNNNILQQAHVVFNFVSTLKFLLFLACKNVGIQQEVTSVLKKINERSETMFLYMSGYI